MTTPPGRQLARLLEAPHLERVVPGLAPETLHQIVRHAGLEACVDLVALATPAQLTAILDLDLWARDHGGCDERFDATRFAEWIEALTDTDASLAARTVAALEVPLVVAGLAAFIRVADPAAVLPYTTLDGEQIGADPATRGVMTAEVGGYRIDAIRTDVWDAIIALLVALDADHGARFHEVMRGCRVLSYSRPEVDGLDPLLMAAEQAMLDLSTGREVRRARQGYVAADESRAFLQTARTRLHDVADARSLHPVIREYTSAATRDVGNSQPSVDTSAKALLASSGSDTPLPGTKEDTREAYEALAELLADAGATMARPLALLDGRREHGGQGKRDDTFVHLRALLEHLSHTDHAAYEARTRELAFLSNALLAGCAFHDRAFTPNEASSAAAAVCNLGLECAARPGTVACDLIAAFETGWTVLYEDVVLLATGRLIDLLGGVKTGDTDTHVSIVDLRRRLITARAAGTPWQARESLDLLAVLDVGAWKGLLGLIDECPVMPAVIDATLDGRTGAISATDYELISTMAQVARAQAFVARVPGLLAG